MIPVLYPSTETAFTTNGLGGLPDAISCVVTEQRNTQGGYYLEMEYPVDGLHYDLLAPERIIYAAPSMGNTPQPFRISRITRPINGIVHIEAPHLCAELQKLTSWGIDAGTNIQGMIYNQFYRARQLGQTVPFWCETDITVESDVTFSHPEPASLADILLGAEGSVLDVVGGEYEFDGYHIILHSQRGTDSGLEIRYGVNMSDLEAETDATELVTACVPYWKGTANEVDTVVIGDMCSASNASAYAYVRCVPLDVSQQFEETDTQPTKADVTAKGQAFINSTSRRLLQTSIRVSYEPTTSGIGERRINLCDTVRVVYPDLAVSSISKVVETRFNTLIERYDELTIGTIRNNIVDTIAGLISGGVTYSGGGGGGEVGPQGPPGADGQDGQDGQDGVSPAVSVSVIEGGHRVTITDANGTKTFDVLDGATGADGQDGADGVSPTVTVTAITGGHRVTITDKSHPSGVSFDVMDGSSATNLKRTATIVKTNGVWSLETSGTTMTWTDLWNDQAENITLIAVDGTNVQHMHKASYEFTSSGTITSVDLYFSSQRYNGRTAEGKAFKITVPSTGTGTITEITGADIPTSGGGGGSGSYIKFNLNESTLAVTDSSGTAATGRMILNVCWSNSVVLYGTEQTSSSLKYNCYHLLDDDLADGEFVRFFRPTSDGIVVLKIGAAETTATKTVIPYSSASGHFVRIDYNSNTTAVTHNGTAITGAQIKALLDQQDAGAIMVDTNGNPNGVYRLKNIYANGDVEFEGELGDVVMNVVVPAASSTGNATITRKAQVYYYLDGTTVKSEQTNYAVTGRQIQTATIDNGFAPVLTKTDSYFSGTVVYHFSRGDSYGLWFRRLDGLEEINVPWESSTVVTEARGYNTPYNVRAAWDSSANKYVLKRWKLGQEVNVTYADLARHCNGLWLNGNLPVNRIVQSGGWITAHFVEIQFGSGGIAYVHWQIEAGSSSGVSVSRAVLNRNPVTIYRDATGLAAIEANMSADPAWQLTGLDLTPFKRIKIYTKAAQKSGTTASASTTPSACLEMLLDPYLAGPYGGHYLASTVIQKSNDNNRLVSLTCAVSSDKTKFVVLRQTNLYGTAATNNNDVGSNVVRIEGYYD